MKKDLTFSISFQISQHSAGTAALLEQMENFSSNLASSLPYLKRDSRRYRRSESILPPYTIITPNIGEQVICVCFDWSFVRIGTARAMVLLARDAQHFQENCPLPSVRRKLHVQSLLHTVGLPGGFPCTLVGGLPSPPSHLLPSVYMKKDVPVDRAKTCPSRVRA